MSESAPWFIAMESTRGCQLDSDCITGAFCFHNTCTKQCDETTECASGFACSADTGRCVSRSFLEKRAAKKVALKKLGESDKGAIDQIESDISEIAASNVVTSVIGQKDAEGKTIEKIDFLVPVQNVVQVSKGEKTVSVSFTTSNDLGTIHYLVEDTNEQVASTLQTARFVKDETISGGKTIDTYRYGFVLPTGKAGAEEAQNETYTIVSSAGRFVVTLVPRAEADGIYDGFVAPTNILSGIDLPLRMAIKTVPETPANFSAITSLTLMLPASGNDLFSPGTPADKVTWHQVTAAKVPASECRSQQPCFAAVFSTNAFVAPGSGLINDASKINRSIRVEITDYDSDTQAISGLIIDNLTGLYRVKNVQADGDLAWNVAEMVGDFTLNRQSSQLPEETQIHTAANADDGLRELTSEPANVCDDSSITTLFKLVPRNSPETETCHDVPDGCSKEYLAACDDPANTPPCENAKYNDCKEVLTCKTRVENYDANAPYCNITTVDGYHSLDFEHKSFCLDVAVKQILTNENRLSAILAGVLAGNGDQTSAGFSVDETCKVNKESTIKTFTEFAQACIKEDCKLCAEKPEIACAADLIARQYLGLDRTSSGDTKLNLMTSWLDLMHESYLGQQYVAWSQDTQIRRNWLEGAVFAETFASSVMKDHNDTLLKNYRKTVLDTHHDVLSKQFSQTSLEMLGQALEDTGQGNITELSSSRNAILTELADTWQGLAEGLALATRRHDVLTQNDAERIQTASELRTYLFDLYFAGLVESNINLAADQGSLNATYGTHLSNIVSKLQSLDQGFESLVFMRDGEVFTDTRLETNTTLTSLGSLQKDAKDSVAYAIAYRTAVFQAMDKKQLAAAELEDLYETSLAGMRTELVNLCGFPKDCTNKAECEINTEAFYCGFEINKDDAAGQLGDERSPISTNADVKNSQAGSAILEYRQALYDYKSAEAERDALAQKVDNNEAYYQRYKDRIESWNNQRLQLFKDIEDVFKKIDDYGSILGELEDSEARALLEKAQSEAQVQKSAFEQWDSLASSNLASSISLETLSLAFAESARWTKFSEDILRTSNELTALVNPSYQTSIYVMHSISTGLESAQAATDFSNKIANMTFTYNVSKIDRQKDVDLAELEKGLQETLYKLNNQKGEIQGEIDSLNRHIEDLKILASQQEQYNRDCNDLDARRTEFDNLKLDFASKQYIVYVKQVGVYKALLNYYNIVQHAQMVEAEYKAKEARYKNIQNLANSPASIFQYAKDLETVEYFIESARNDLSDYLAAIEYLTVRPFVDLRRAIYTARGTNELEKIFEQLNDLTNRCGSGQESTNQVTISLRNRMGIDSTEYNGLTPADRFHYSLQTNTLPISTQTRYIVGSSIKDKLVAGSFYNASFNLSSSFANIRNTCNAKIDEIQVRFVSKPGTKIREDGDATASITLFYGGHGQLLSCHDQIKAITESIGSRTSYGEYSTFNTKPFGNGIGVSIYDVPAGEDYRLTQDVVFNKITNYKGLKGYPLMATYTVLFDPNIGENNGIIWNNVADIELQISYTTGSLGQDSSRCQYDI